MKCLRLLLGAALAVALALASTVGGAAAAPTRHSVAAYQRQLDGLGCDAGGPDGRMDRHTRSALVRLQTRLGLRATGRADAATRRALRRTSRRCDRRPVPAGSGHGRRIVVSERQDWVWLVRSDGSVAAQAGTVDNPSVLGRGTYSTGSYCGRAARIRHNTDLSGRYWLDASSASRRAASASTASRDTRATAVRSTPTGCWVRTSPGPTDASG